MPAEPGDIRFRPMERSDLARVATFLERPHVSRWVGNIDRELHEIEDHILGRTSVAPYIIELDGREIGYIQSYDIHAENAHPYNDQPAGTVGMDLYIGEVDCVGRGLGTVIVGDFVGRLFEAGAPRVVIDPHPDNGRAIRAYEKAGFRPLGPRNSEYGPALLMAQDRQQQRPA